MTALAVRVRRRVVRRAEGLDLEFVRRGVVNGLAVLGAIFAVGLTVILIASNRGGLAYDTESYTRAVHNLLTGAQLYLPPTDVSTYGTYRYPPVFAQLFVPSALLPDLAVHWLWRVSGVLCLRYMAGSWRGTLICFLLPPVFRELALGNVTLQLDAALLFAVRDRRGAVLLPWFAALKFGPVLLMPYLWLRHPDSRRPLILGTAVFAAACALSFVVAPSLWGDYLGTFGWETATEMYSPVILAIVPAYGGLDFAIRFGLAALAVAFAWRTSRDWLAYAAAAITCPYLDWGRLSALVGLWRFRPAGGPDPAPGRPDRAAASDERTPALAAAEAQP